MEELGNTEGSRSLGSAESLCSGARNSSALRDVSPTFGVNNGGKLREKVGYNYVLISWEPISVQSK